jgi:hypothetical protein
VTHDLEFVIFAQVWKRELNLQGIPHTGMNSSIPTLNRNALLPPMERERLGDATAGAAPMQYVDQHTMESFHRDVGMVGIPGRAKTTLTERALVRRPGLNSRPGVARKTAANVCDANEADVEGILSLAVSTLYDQFEDDASGDTEGRHRAAQVWLEQQGYDPLQRYVLLQKALLEVEGRMPTAEKTNLVRHALNDMQNEVFGRHVTAIRAGVQASAAMAYIVNSMNAATDRRAASSPELRSLYGARTDEPMTALTMLRAMANHFGHEQVVTALGRLQSLMMSGLRSSW